MKKNVLAIIIGTLFFMIASATINYLWTLKGDLKSSIIHTIVPGMIMAVTLYFIDRKRRTGKYV